MTTISGFQVTTTAGDGGTTGCGDATIYIRVAHKLEAATTYGPYYMAIDALAADTYLVEEAYATVDGTVDLLPASLEQNLHDTTVLISPLSAAELAAEDPDLF